MSCSEIYVVCEERVVGNRPELRGILLDFDLLDDLKLSLKNETQRVDSSTRLFIKKLPVTGGYYLPHNLLSYNSGYGDVVFEAFGQQLSLSQID